MFGHTNETGTTAVSNVHHMMNFGLMNNGWYLLIWPGLAIVVFIVLMSIHKKADNQMVILKKRFAKGEITSEELHKLQLAIKEN